MSITPSRTAVVFNPEDESVLRQWEEMHRPSDTFPTSGPVFTGGSTQG